CRRCSVKPQLPPTHTLSPDVKLPHTHHSAPQQPGWAAHCRDSLSPDTFLTHTHTHTHTQHCHPSFSQSLSHSLPLSLYLSLPGVSLSLSSFSGVPGVSG